MDGELSVEDLADLLEADADVRVVDIRSPGAYARGHIPGSENIPFPQLTQRVEELAGADRVVTVCPHGESSVQAARLIGSYEGTADATVESLREGLTGWEGPVESGEPAAPDGSDGPDAPF
jgi:rhodanese-related sulfurtransferase